MRITNLLAKCALLLSLGVSVRLCQADEIPLIDFTGGATTVIAGNDTTDGFSMLVTTPTIINGLGIFDVGADGLFDSHQVGIWDSTGTLLASATVDNTSNVVASSSGLGNWREIGITPLTLNAGMYVLGAFYRDADLTPGEDPFAFGGTASSISGVSLGTPLFSASGFTEPENPVAAADGLFGPMAFTSSVPEPGSIILLLTVIAVVCRVVGKNGLRRRSPVIES